MTTPYRIACALALLTPPLLAQAQRRGRDREARSDDERSVTVAGTTRTFVVRAPRNATRPLPVVLVFHGGGGNAANAEQMSGFTRLVEREGLIAVYPNGSGRLGERLLTWNAGHCCGYAMDRRVDDVAFVDAIIDVLARERAIDTGRIYLTGMSNGGMITHYLAARMRHRPAAIAPVVGAVFGDEPSPASPVSAIIFNGLLDTSVPAKGGLGDGLGRRAWDGTPPRPNEAQGEYWARSARCVDTPQRTEDARVIHWMWTCPDGRAVELHQIKDNGHAWPGGRAGRRGANAPSDAMDATEAMWAFFKTKRANG